MERGSDKHGPRQDEQLAHEVQGLVRGGHSTHAQDWKEPEPSGEDQPQADFAPDRDLIGGTPDGMTPGDVEGRSELARYLGRAPFPATGGELVDRATEALAPDDVVRRLATLAKDQTFANVQQVWAALGGGVEEHRA